MDHKPSHRELGSVLISDLYQKVISQRDIGKGMKDKMNVVVIFQGKINPKTTFELIYRRGSRKINSIFAFC